jgi:cytochrome c553
MNVITIKLGVVLLLVSFTAASAQTTRTKQIMRAKLDHSQKILEAVVTSNWPLLDRESRDMALVVRDPTWSSAMMPDYVRYADAFLRATNDLTEAAKARDLEAASLGLISLTTSCVSCHRYVARSRIVTAVP